MNVLDLFSGIGGFSLGLERAGMKTVAFCEVDKKCQAVLKKHWPGVPIFDDVSNLKGEDIEETVDVICGGFPCQDISLAGKGAGLEGKRSGLWSEFKRLIEEIKPRYAIVENVSALRSRGLDQVLREISEIGYDAEWHCITASSIGAPHRRDRIWIVAYPRDNTRRESETLPNSKSKLSNGNNTYSESSKPSAQELGSSDSERDVVNSNNDGSYESKDSESNQTRDDGDKTRQNKSFKSQGSSNLGENFQGSREEVIPDSNNIGQMLRGSSEAWRIEYGQAWTVEPDVGRVAHGVSGRVDRLKQLGNAVVPQIPELIGRAICQVG